MTVLDETALAVDCPTPAKSKYATQEAAQSAAHRVQIPVGQVLTPYSCRCGWVHLTSRPQRPQPTIDDIAQVHALDDDQFRVLVIDDARYRAAWIRSRALRDRSLVHRWIAVLKAKQKDLNLQLADRDAGYSEEWRQMATELRDNIAERRREAAALIASYGSAARVSTGGSVAERRSAAGEAAMQRLIDAHQAEYTELLVEEFQRVGLDVPNRVIRWQQQHHADADARRKQSA